MPGPAVIPKQLMGLQRAFNVDGVGEEGVGLRLKLNRESWICSPNAKQMS